MFGSRLRRDADDAAPYFSDAPALRFKGGNSTDTFPFQRHKLAIVSSPAKPVTTDWDELLGLIKQTGKTVQATEQRALTIASHAESMARDAVNELERAKQAVETARANEQSALERAQKAEDRAYQAERRALQAEDKASELETMFAQIRDALWADIIHPHISEPQTKAAA
jgi:hypothetical protein